MKSHITSKITKYLADIFKMEFRRDTVKLYKAIPKCNVFEKNVSPNDGILIGYIELPLI